MKKLCILLGVIIMLLTGCNKDEKYNVEINVKDYGVIKLELDSKEAPITVKNFVDLVESGFYDGLTFHRIIDGFMVQGGDPLGNGTGGSDKKIKGEYSANGVKNNISHKRGVISMARNPYDMNSASSQFFIVQQDSTYLDGKYAAFGLLLHGYDVLDEIANTKTDEDDKPINDQTIKQIRFVDVYRK